MIAATARSPSVRTMVSSGKSATYSASGRTAAASGSLFTAVSPCRQSLARCVASVPQRGSGPPSTARYRPLQAEVSVRFRTWLPSLLLSRWVSGGCHLNPSEARAFDGLLYQPGGLGLFDELADIGDTPWMPLRNECGYTDDAEAVLQHPR